MKILVRAPNWVGDAVMAIPALEAIRGARADDECIVGAGGQQGVVGQLATERVGLVDGDQATVGRDGGERSGTGHCPEASAAR